MSRVFTLAVLAFAGVASAQPLVRVTVDMDARQPGIQSTVVIGPDQSVVRDVAVYIFAVEGAPTFLSLGYVGGIDRGLAFGHQPGNRAVGAVSRIVAHPGTPAYPSSQIELLDACCIIPWFSGPEVHYLEFGGEKPAVIQPWPVEPVFTVDIELSNQRLGDVYGFHLLDAVAANWGPIGRHGMFTTDASYYLNTGGDATPDSTPTKHGLDPDAPVPAPPATFLVDIVDGPPATGGGATIQVRCAADFNLDGGVTSQDFFDFLDAFFAAGPIADFNRDGAVNSQDFFDYLNAFFAGCP